MNNNDKQRIHDLVWRILEDIGSECEGVDFRVDDIFIENQTLPALFIKWNPKIHPKTIHDPVQVIILNSPNTEVRVSDDSLRRIIREKLEHMIAVDQHANRIVSPKEKPPKR
jgi:hypothetical protein